MRQEPRLPQVKHEYIPLEGGLDLLTPPLSLKPGVLRETLNYEVSVNGGYSRVEGYERFDGRPNPSDQNFSTITLSAIGTLVVGDTVNGQTSGATGYIIAIDGLVVVMTKTTGAFAVAENAREGVAVQGTVTAVGSVVTSARDAAIHRNQAADVYRADILAVPGSGPIRGVVYYNGLVYAWRDNVGATALAIYKSSAAGWVLVPLGWELSFTAGLAAGIVEGNTVTGLTSGATGVVSRVVIQSGAFSTNDAAGRLILSSTTGTFQAAETLRVAGTNRATCSGAAAVIAPLPGGRVYTDIHSFGGSAQATSRVYGADGVNRAFEFDGTVYVPIATGMSPDAPQLAKVHQRHLFLAFGSSVQHSGIGRPYVWSPLFGAGELSVNGAVTDWETQPGAQTTGALVIYSRNATAILYGTSSATWNLTEFQSETGALPYTAQLVGASYALDDRGVVELTTAQNYGNFTENTLTANIRPWIQSRRNRVVGSAVNREKSQYRLFFDDGSGLYLTITNNRFRGAMPVAFPHPVTVACNGETPDGSETNFFGSSNGFVYRLDAGTSFDGDPISATALLTFAAQGDSRVRKRYRGGSIEMQGNGYAEIQVGYNLSYGDTTVIDQGEARSYANSFSAPYWDLFTWDAFVWDGLTLSPSDIEITGTAENIALRIDSNSDYFEAFTLNSLILHYTLGRGLR